VWTDFPYAELHLPANQLAHLVLVDNPSFHPDGDYALNAAGQVCSKGERYNYAGIAVLSPALFVGCQPGRFGLKQVYDRAMQQGQLSGEYYCGGWFNVGTQVELAALTEHLSLIGRE
jgi:MurNAc alpha-1-phosphate uridylyltransferase